MNTLAIINAALQYASKEFYGEIKRYHFSNYAVDQVLTGDGNSGVFELHRMWEDADPYGQQDAIATANLIDGLVPFNYVLIDTGDYIVNEQGFIFGNWRTDTYDPDYRMLLVHESTFVKYQQALERVDREWRTERQAIANGNREAMKAEE